MSTAAREWLLEQAGVEPSTGARPLRRTIQRHIQDRISEILIERRDEAIELVEVEMEEGELRFVIPTGEALPAEA